MANPALQTLSADAWTAVATAVSAGVIYIKDTSPTYLQTYRMTGDPAPTTADEGVAFSKLAIISATAKAVAQYALEKQDASASKIASIFMAAYSFATTAADVRIWTTLPKNFQVARFPKPKDGQLKVTPPGSTTMEINIPDCNNAIVYVRITASQSESVFEVMTF